MFYQLLEDRITNSTFLGSVGFYGRDYLRARELDIMMTKSDSWHLTSSGHSNC